MNREEYQNAFSKLEPSAALVNAVLSPKPKRSNGLRCHMGRILLAGVLIVTLLTGAIFAAVRFQWFQIRDVGGIIQPTYDNEAIGKDVYLPIAPHDLLVLEGEYPENYIGFTLPKSYLGEQDTLNCRFLRDGLYGRYYRDSDPTDPDSHLLTVEIVYDGNYLTRNPSEIVKEATLNGMQTVWFRLGNALDKGSVYCLFQHNERMDCYVVIASTLGFEEAEQIARDLCFEDSGIPIEKSEDLVYYGFRMNWAPKDMVLDNRTLMADRSPLANAILQEESLDLNEIYLGCRFYQENEFSHCGVGVGIEEGLTDMTPIKNGTVYKTGTINGHDARWVHGSDRATYIVVMLREQQVQMYAHVSSFGLNSDTGEWEEAPVEESFVKIAEKLLESAEVIPVVISDPAPRDFQPGYVG